MAGALQYVREVRHMPFLRRGMRVDVNGKGGKVTSAYSANIMVRLDGSNFSVNCHPHWRTTYYDASGNIIKDYKKEAISQ